MKEINCLGMRCPQPIIEMAKAIREIAVNQSVILISDDPTTEIDLRAWARMTGNEILMQSKTQYKITKK
jgi:cysteine desulfurase